MKNIFNIENTQELKNRINKLNQYSTPQWGKMSASQMLAHCNVAYEMTYDTSRFKKPKGLKKVLFKLVLKPIVIGKKPFRKNSQTAPEFRIENEKNFENEKQRMFDYIDKTQQLGVKYFEGKESLAFGNLTSNEWNNLFYKHLNHHLDQFGV